MNNRQRIMAVLNYEEYDRLPVLHFGYWRNTLSKWAEEGHLTKELAAAWNDWNDGSAVESEISELLGFDANWFSVKFGGFGLRPWFEEEVLEEFSDGAVTMLSRNGVIVKIKEGTISISQEIDHLLKDRASWEKEFVHRLEFTPERVTGSKVFNGRELIGWNDGGLDFLKRNQRDFHYGLFVGSLIGIIRDWLGVENLSYLPMDDPELFKEIIDTNAELVYQCMKYTLDAGAKFDFIHFWEDICFNHGPLISPDMFKELIAPHYSRLSKLAKDYGIDIVSVDSDGKIDDLVDIWLDCGVNTMFPIEVGTWNASIKPWKKNHGGNIRGIGGMNKNVFAMDKSAIDAEIERLRPLVELGGYIPCPDHRISPDAKWDNVRYYTERMREVF